VTIPVSKLAPVLRGGSQKVEQVVDDTDIPKATPPNKRPDKP
jgi:hypothetical protein